LRYVPLLPDGQGQWSYDLSELKAAFSLKTKLIVINTPLNPLGKVFSLQELEQIAELCLKHNAYCVCDEVYEHILFDGHRLARMASLPEMQSRTISISSAGKTFSATGWKIGWIVAPAAISLGIRRIHQWVPFAVATPLQLAVSLVLKQAPQRGYYEELQKMYQHKRDHLAQILTAAHLQPVLPQGTFFIMADISQHPFEDDLSFCRSLIEQKGVAAIPPRFFYSTPHQHLAKHWARFCFCKTHETLKAAGERLAGF
jgi:N-succinyldiaminopimelate aminotransferase